MSDPQRLPHVLFVTEKWCDCDPELGPTNSAHNLWGSLEQSGLATFDTFHFDEHWLIHHEPGDRRLLALCEKQKPTLVLVSVFVDPLPERRRRFNPALETLDRIRQTLGIPVVTLWFDAARPAIIQLADLMGPFVSFHVILDSTCGYLTHTREPERFLPLWTPQDPILFFNPELKRDIACSFVGSLEHYQDRRSAVEALLLARLPLIVGGGQREARLSPEAYGRLFMRSRIALNFASSREQRYFQVKGRVFEALLCGAMLLEQANPETEAYFRPMRDYVPFHDNRDLVDKLRYYLDHDSERAEIAARGHQRACEHFTAAHFWKRLLEVIDDYRAHEARAVLGAAPLFWPSNGIYDGRTAALEAAELLMAENDDYPAHKLLRSFLASAEEPVQALEAVAALFQRQGKTDEAEACYGQARMARQGLEASS